MGKRITVADLIEHLETLPMNYEVWSLDCICSEAEWAPVTVECVRAYGPTRVDGPGRVEISGDACER
jgi:hypothetical protein